MTLGVMFALLAAIFWGSYVVPQVKLKSSPSLIVSILATTNFIVSLIMFRITSPGINTEIIILGFIAGSLWSLAQINNLIGVKKIKFGRFSSVCSSIQILLNFFFGVIIFNEIIKYFY